MKLRFEDIEIDSELYEVRRGGTLVPVEPKVFDLLVFFTSNPGRVISRDDLIDSVWSKRVVADATIASAVKAARRAVGDDGQRQRFIKTVHGRGFRFDADVTGASNEDAQRASGKHAHTRASGYREPSLQVLPFQATASDDAASESLAKALSADLETILTRVPLLRIRSPHPSQDNAHNIPSGEIDQNQLGHYLLEGSVQRAGEGFRVNVRLSDADTRYRLWAEQFDHTPSSEQMSADRLVIAIIGKLEPQLYRAIHDTVRSSLEEPGSRELYLRASTLLALRGWHRDTFTESADLLRRSIQLEPDFALATAYLALVLALGHRVGLLSERDAMKAEAMTAAERALRLDSMDSTVLGFAGCAMADLGMVSRSIPILRKAIARNPANAQAWAALGSACLIDGKTEQAIEHLRHGIAISPLDNRLSVWGALLALAYLRNNDVEMARDAAVFACQQDDLTYLPRVVLAAVNARLSDQRAVDEALADARRIKPDLTDSEIVALVGRKSGRLLGIES
jgi:DNA-binding winged helix-turn-helix (wHTH) protein